MTDKIDGLTVAIGLDTGRFKSDLTELRKASEGFGASLSRGLTGAVFEGRKLSDVLRGLALSLSRRALNSALQPVGQGVGNIFGQLFGSLIPSARGNVFSQGSLVPFANGGIVNGPSAFPLRGGTVGLMGEAGPEAILPLARGPDGRLGVRSGGAGGGGANITVNITTPDPQSFARSRSQIATLITRAAERGSRNL